MRMCHAVRPTMLEGGGGAIVNFSSTYGNGINPDNAINFVPVTYSTAKGAIRGFTTTLARDLAPKIRVNALAPGPISGEWETEWGVSPEHVDEAIDRKSTRLNSSHLGISYAVFCLKKKTKNNN